MKPHLPLLLLSAIIFSHSSAMAADTVLSAGILDLQWSGGATGNWNTTDSSWKTIVEGVPTGDLVGFVAGSNVLFGQQEGVDAATITLATGGITSAGVKIASSSTHYTLTGGTLTATEFVKDGVSAATLDGTMTFDTMKIGTVAIGNTPEGLAGTLNIAGSVTTGSFQGATAGNARYILNLEAGGKLIVTGGSSDKASASMILAINGFGETNSETDVTTFNMRGGELSVEGATMFFANDGHVTWNMGGGKATLLGLDMTSIGSKRSKLFLTGGEIAIGANGLTVNANSANTTIELGNGTLAAYESWKNASTANMSLTDATNGTKIKVVTDASMELSGIISDKSGVNGKLVKQGEGHLIMSGANTYSGETLVEAGTLTLTNLTGYRGAITAQGGITNLTDLTGYTGTINAQGGRLNLTNLTTADNYDLVNVTGTSGTLHLESGTFSVSGTSMGTVSLGGATLSANGATLVMDVNAGDTGDKISFTGALSGALNIQLSGAVEGGLYTLFSTGSEANALASIDYLNFESKIFAGEFRSASNGDIQFYVTGTIGTILTWTGGNSGTWSNGSTTWTGPDGNQATFDSSVGQQIASFGEQTAGAATITLDDSGIIAKDVIVESNLTNYTFTSTSGVLKAESFTKDGTSAVVIDLAYDIPQFDINGGSVELKKSSSKELTITGKGELNVNWGNDDTTVTNVILAGHTGALTLTSGGIRTSSSELANESSLSMKGGKIYLTDAGDITLALKDLSVSNTGSEINRDNAGNITWKTALTGIGTLTLNLDGTLNLDNTTASFANFDGTLAVNGNINVSGTNTFKNTAGLILGEGKILKLNTYSRLQGLDSVTLSKNTNVRMDNGTLSATTIALNAEGGSVTFSEFQSGASTLSGKITGTADQLIFNHDNWGNPSIHSNWAGSDYTGITIFKATGTSEGEKIRLHEYKVAGDSTGVITPWGNAGNLVQIGSSDTKESINVQFSELNTDASVSIGNNIELITGLVAGKNSSLEFTSGSYDLTGKVTITNGNAEGANKAIIKSSGANITLSGGLSGAGPLDVDMAAGKTLLLKGTSDYTGTLSVVNGILSLGADFATGTIQVDANGILTASGNGSVSNLILNGGAISLTGSDNLSIKSLVDNSETKGVITVADTSSVTFTDTLSVGNKVTGTGSVKIAGAADTVVSLTGTNDYSGKTQITSGTALAGNAPSFGSSTISVSDTGILDMNNVALGNALIMEGSSQLKNAGAYAGAEASAILKDMTGNLSLGGLNANKIASISTKIVDAVNGATLKDIGGSSMKLGSSSLAVGVNNLYASVDINNPNKPYPGSSEAILQFSNSGAIVEMIQNATLTLNLEDADLVAKMQAMQSVGSQTFQLLITNGSLSKGLGSIDFTGLEADFKLVQIDGGNVIVSGDLSNIYALASGQTRTISDGTFFNPFLQVLVNGTLTLEGTAQDNVVLKNLAGKQSGIINITDVGSVTLNVADADKTATYEGKLTGTNTTLIKTGEGKQELLGGLDFADSKVELQEGALVLGGTSTVGTLIAKTGTLDLTKDSTLNLTGADSTLSGDVTLSGEGSLVVAPTVTLSLTENAKLDGVKLTLDGGNLDLGATTSSKVSALNGNGNLIMAGGALNIAGKAGQASIFNGSLVGTGKVQVSGEGTQELVGAGNADYDLDVTGGSLVLRGDVNGSAMYKSLNAASGANVTIGTIGETKTSPMTRVSLSNGGTINSGATLSFIYNTNLSDALTSGPLLTTGGLLDIQSGSTIDVRSLDNNLEGASELGGNDLSLVLATKTGNGSITLGDGVNLKTGGLFKTLFDQTQLQLDDAGNLVFKGTVRIENLFNQAVTSANTATASDLLWKNRYIDAGSELGKLIAFLGDAISAGDLAEANHAMAASVGSTVTSLHAAQKDDFYKQQMWVRNRVAQMGVNPDYVNEDMPYVNMWMQANSSYDNLNGKGDESGYKLTTWGGTVGFDVNTSEAWTFGGAFTASYGNLTAKAADTAKGDFDTYYANLFARMQVGKWSHSLIVSGGWNDMNLNRNVSYDENSYATRGTTNGTSYGAMYEATYDVAMGKAGKSVFQPLFNASIQKSKVDSYSETGAGNAGLDVSGMDSTTGTMGVGARLMGMVGSNLFGREVLGELRAMVVQDLGDRRSSATVGFLNDISYKNQVRGVKAGSTGAQLGGSLVIPVGMQNSSIYVDVNADLRSKATSINGNIGYRYSF